MVRVEAKDKVQWRAGDTPKASHLRTGVIKEVLAAGLCLVSTKVDGVTVVEEIRMARLKPLEVPATAKKTAGKPAAKKARKSKKSKKAAKVEQAEKPAAAEKAPAKKAKKSKKAKKKAA